MADISCYIDSRNNYRNFYQNKKKVQIKAGLAAFRRIPRTNCFAIIRGRQKSVGVLVHAGGFLLIENLIREFLCVARVWASWDKGDYSAARSQKFFSGAQARAGREGKGV
jgi:hypothetical protein